MAYTEYDKVPAIQSIPREYTVTSTVDSTKTVDSSDYPVLTGYYVAGVNSPKLFIPTRYRFTSPDATIGGAFSISQTASSTQSYSPAVPIEVSTTALDDAGEEEDELARTTCSTLSFSVTLDANRNITAISGTLGGESEALAVDDPKPFHAYSRSYKEFIPLAVSTSTTTPNISGSWAGFSWVWEDKYDYYLVSQCPISVNTYYAPAYPDIHVEITIDVEIEGGSTDNLFNYFHDMTTSDYDPIWGTYRTESLVETVSGIYKFHGLLSTGTLGDPIRVRLAYSNVNVISIGGGVSCTLIRVPKGATVSLYNLATNLSFVAEPDTVTTTDVDTITIPELANAINVSFYYYMSDLTSNLTFTPGEIDSGGRGLSPGGVVTRTLSLSGTDLTLRLSGGFTTIEGEGTYAVDGSATAVGILAFWKDGQALAAAPGVGYYGI